MLLIDILYYDIYYNVHYFIYLLRKLFAGLQNAGTSGYRRYPAG